MPTMGVIMARMIELDCTPIVSTKPTSTYKYSVSHPGGRVEKVLYWQKIVTPTELYYMQSYKFFQKLLTDNISNVLVHSSSNLSQMTTRIENARVFLTNKVVGLLKKWHFLSISSFSNINQININFQPCQREKEGFCQCVCVSYLWSFPRAQPCSRIRNLPIHFWL